MLRNDIIWIIPSVIIALYQAKVLWKALPAFRHDDTEVAGEYTDFEYIWFWHGRRIISLLFLFQLFFPLYQITSNITVVALLRLTGYLLVAAGFIVSYLALKVLGNNWTGMLDYRIKKGQILERKGIYQTIRHPIYLAVIMEITGYQFIVTSWLVIPLFIITLIIFYRHILKEDKLLEIKFKDEFTTYKQTTKTFIPWVF